MLGWMNHTLKSRLLGEISRTSDMQVIWWYNSKGRKWRGTKEPLDKGERGGWKTQLKDGDCSHEIKRHLLLGRKAMTKLDSILNSREIWWLKRATHVCTKLNFFSCFQVGQKVFSQCLEDVVLENTLESPLDCREIQPVHPKGNQSWILIGRTDAEAEIPILWPPDVKNWLTGKDHDAGEDWRQEEKGMTEDEMVGWHHRLNGYEFQQVL